jgi:hypothetical protein
LKRFLHGPFAPALLAILAFARVALSVPADPEASEPPPGAEAERVEGMPFTDEARALLGDLQVAATVEGGWEVTETYGPVDGSIIIGFARDDASFELRLVRRGAAEGRPVLEDERFDYLYNPTSDATDFPFDDVEPVIQEVSRRLAADVEIPSGMWGITREEASPRDRGELQAQ